MPGTLEQIYCHLLAARTEYDTARERYLKAAWHAERALQLVERRISDVEKELKEANHGEQT